MSNYNIMTFSDLNSTLSLIQRKKSTLLIGIDGPGGAGKSMFAKTLASFIKNVTVVAMDDFFLPSTARIPGNPRSKPIGADFDWQRTYIQVLSPLNEERVGIYQRYDWETDQLAEWHLVPLGGCVIIEGIYSTRKEIAHLYDFKIWLECPHDIRLARGIIRSGEQIREIWENDWMIAEDLYIETDSPAKRANLIVDSSGKSSDNSTHEFVYLHE